MIQTAGNLAVREGYIPDMYSPDLKEKFRHNTFLSRITNRDFQGKFRNKGDTIHIRMNPNIRTRPYVLGQNVVYEDPESKMESHTITRARYYAYTIRDVQAELSNLSSFSQKWTKEGGAQFAEDNEEEFLSDIYAKCHVKNQGSTAGIKSEAYDLGTANAPLYVYKDNESLKGANAGINNKNLVVDAITEAAAALQEQPGGMSDTLNPWIIIPVWMAQRIQTSELKNAALSGDATSMLRKSAQAIGNIGGFDVYQSNLLPIFEADGGLPRRFMCLFGDKSAISFADEINRSEMLRGENDFADKIRSLMVYDWFVTREERFGHMIVARG